MGLTEPEGQGSLQSNEVRFQQHKRKTIEVFKNSDLFHIVLAGKVAEYMTERGITRVSPDLLDQIVYTKTVIKDSFKPGDLQKLETQTINKYISEGHTIYNSNKRVDVARSNSRSTSTRLLLLYIV